MNCTNCNAPLEANARFCRTCGATVTVAAPATQYQPAPKDDRPPIQSQRQQGPSFQQPTQQQWSQPPSAYQQSVGPAMASSPSSQAGNKPARRWRRRLTGCLITFLVVLLILSGVWFLIVRPYLSNLVVTQIDGTLTDAVNQIPPFVSLVPAIPIPVPDKLVNALITLKPASSDVVQNVRVHITSSQVRIEFQVFGIFSCAATGTPEVDAKGQVFVPKVGIEGIAGLIVSADDLTPVVNKHLRDVQAKLKHTVKSIQLQDGLATVTLGPSTGGGGLPPLPTPPVSLPTPPGGFPTLPPLP